MSDSMDIFSKIPEMKYSEKAIDVSAEEFEKVVHSRRSVRVYTDEVIPDEIVHKCLDLALLAPNSSNLQPWEFYRIKSPDKKKLVAKYCYNQPAARTAAELIVCVARRDTWQKHAKQMLQFFEESDQEVPKSAIAYYKKLVPLAYNQGPFSLLTPIKRTFIAIKGINDVINREPSSISDMRIWMHKSTALACENLMLAFRAFGYDSCPMEGCDSKRIRSLLKLPAEAELCMVISAGKRAENGVYGERVRFPREQFIFEV
jgi:nitroreductase